jgi:catechol 2,3-dioxygenase-like lactoylglutathione lyase family enzyme
MISMARVIGVDHLVIRVGDFEKSRRFYDSLFTFLGFKSIDDFSDMIGWRNGRTAFWISPASGPRQSQPYREGSVGFHHYGLELRSRKDVDELESFLKTLGAEIVNPAGEYYEDYYAVYFKDPDGLKLEGLTYGPGHLHAARQKKR